MVVFIGANCYVTNDYYLTVLLLLCVLVLLSGTRWWQTGRTPDETTSQLPCTAESELRGNTSTSGYRRQDANFVYDGRSRGKHCIVSAKQ